MQNRRPCKISVAIATYNGEAFIEETLTSILEQSVKPCEVVVVDDGSTDNTGAVLNKFGDQITVLTIENCGPETAKKTAIEATTCEWVSICDHDDLWEADHLARLTMLVARYPEVSAAYSNFAEFGDAARFADKFASLGTDYWKDCPADDEGFRLLGLNAYEKLLKANPFFPSAGIFKRSLYEDIGRIRLGISRNPAADGDMTSRIAIQGKVACDDKVTVRIRKYGGNFSGEGLKNAKGVVELLEWQVQEGGIFEPYEVLMRDAIKRQALTMLQEAFSFLNREAFAFAAARLPFAQLPFAMKLRYLLFQLPMFLLRPVFAIVRSLQH